MGSNASGQLRRTLSAAFAMLIFGFALACTGTFAYPTNAPSGACTGPDAHSVANRYICLGAESTEDCLHSTLPCCTDECESNNHVPHDPTMPLTCVATVVGGPGRCVLSGGSGHDGGVTDAGADAGADPCNARGSWTIDTPDVTTGPCAGLRASSIGVQPPESALASGGSWDGDFPGYVLTLDTATCTITLTAPDNGATACPAPLSSRILSVFSTQGGPCHASALCSGRTGCYDTGCTATHASH